MASSPSSATEHPVTGGDRQLDLYRLRRLEGETGEEALRHVVDLVLAETREGVEDVSN